MKPTKILDTPTWWELAHQWYDWVYYSEAWKFMPVTDAIVQWAQNAQDDARMSDNAADWANNVMDWLTAIAMYPVWVATDALWNIWTTAVNWYKKLYNAWADLSNRAKLKLIDKQIKDFQKKNPNRVIEPTKILEETKIPEKTSERFPMTKNLLDNIVEDIQSPEPMERYSTLYKAPLLPATLAWDAINWVATIANNWYKRLYNAWADLANGVKSKLIDKQIKDFQKNNPNKSPATDSEVWNDPRTMYRRLRYIKQQVNPKPRITL